jgi:hypothetical protein
MMDAFKVIANSEKNMLLVQLRGYYMKSELELAFYIARREIKKLKEGYDVVLDLDGMHTDRQLNKTIHSKARRIFITLGAGKIRTISAIAKVGSPLKIDSKYFTFDNVGFYPN